MITRLLTDFSFGEVSPKYDGRIDTAQYYKACSILENFIIMPSGGITRRPGTKYVGEVVNASYKHKIIPFPVSATQTFIMEFGNATLRYWHGNYTQYDNGNNVATPFNSVEVFQLKHAQTFYAAGAAGKHVVHPGHNMVRVRYVSDAFTYENQEVWLTDTGNLVTGANNHPSGVAFGGGRMWLGGTVNKPQTFLASESQSFYNFVVGANNADAFTFTADSDTADQIMWVTGKNDIIAGTLTGEWRIGIDSTVNAPSVRLQTRFGSANIQPVMMGDRIVFVQRGAKRIREYYYLDEASAYQSSDLTRLAEHVTGSGVVDMAIQTSPFTILWVVTADGELAGLTYDREGGVVGWHRHVTDGYFESVAVLPTTGDSDDVWFVVRRTIDGTTKRFIEYMNLGDIDDQRDWVYLDASATQDLGAAETITEIVAASAATITFAATTGFVNDDKVRLYGITDMDDLNGKVYTLKNKSTNTFDLYDSTGTIRIDTSDYDEDAADGYGEQVASTVASGLTHLNGEECEAFADGGVHAAVTPSGGAATLTSFFNTVTVGLPYTSTWRSMSLDFPELGLKIRKILKVRLRLYETISGKVGPNTETLEEILFRRSGFMPGPPEPYTGDYEVMYQGVYDRSGYIMAVQDDPLPMTILAVAADLVTEGN